MLIRTLVALLAMVLVAEAWAADQAAPPLAVVKGQVRLLSPLYVTSPPYDAACDGTTDDRSAIQAALDAASAAGGGVVRVPAGMTCRVGGDVILRSNVALECERGATLKATDSASFTDGMFTTFSLSELQLGANNVSVEGCRLDLNGKKGPAVYLYGEDLVLHRNTVFNGDTSEASDHSLLRMACNGGQNTNACEVTANRVECANTPGAKDIGILVGASDAASKGVRLVGNSVYACDSYGIRGASGSVSLSANNVTVTGTSGVGVDLAGSSSAVLDTKVYASGDSGVGIRLGGRGSMAIGNRVTVSGASGTAFYVTGVVAKVAMNDYALTSASSSSTAVGIYYTGDAIRIVGNTGGTGLEKGDKTHVVVGGQHGTIEGNYFVGGKYGVVPSLSEADSRVNTDVVGNHIWNMSDTGVIVITGWAIDSNYLSWIGGCSIRVGETRSDPMKAGTSHSRIVGNRLHTGGTGKGICFEDTGENVSTVPIVGNEFVYSGVVNGIAIDIASGVSASSGTIANIPIVGNAFALHSTGTAVNLPSSNQNKVTQLAICGNTITNGALAANFTLSMGSICVGGDGSGAFGLVQMTGTTGCGAATTYMANSGCSTTESQVAWTVPAAVTVTGITCNQTADTSCSMRFTLRKNGTDQTDIQCTSTNGAACSDTGSVSFSANDTLAIKLEDTGANCTDNIGASCIVSYAQ